MVNIGSTKEVQQHKMTQNLKSIQEASDANVMKFKWIAAAIRRDVEIKQQFVIKSWQHISPETWQCIFWHSTRQWVCKLQMLLIPGGPQKTEQSIQSIFQDFVLINSSLFLPCWIEHIFLNYNNTKIIKFGWELFILWVISYGLSFSRFARFPGFRGTINDNWMANPENDSP